MTPTFNSNTIIRRRLLCGCAALTALTLTGCGRSDEAAYAGKPHQISAQSACALDGMLLADYAGPKGQIIYKGNSQVNWFCDSVELLNALLKPEQVRPLLAAHVQDMAKADWDKPMGHWIDARQAFYVLGSKRHGSMGPTAASFAAEGPAKAFGAQWGGRVLRFAEIKPEMVDLSGGALHDTRM